jgi:hypothetical protein
MSDGTRETRRAVEKEAIAAPLFADQIREEGMQVRKPKGRT